MPEDRTRQQDRWRRNKRDERARNSIYPVRLPPEFQESVLQERDRRISQTPYVGSYWRTSDFFALGAFAKALQFAADVWAADTVLEARWGPKGGKPSRVAAWLEEFGYPHGYTPASLRKMIPTARERVRILQKTTCWETKEPYWPAFEPLEHD